MPQSSGAFASSGVRRKQHSTVSRPIVHPFCGTFRLLIGGGIALIFIFASQMIILSNVAHTSDVIVSNEMATNPNIEKETPSAPVPPPPVVAFVVSLIKCSKQAATTGFLDAAAILRHSIHKNSAYHNPSSPPSRYGYKMYAIVHTQCAQHGPPLEKLGYKILIRDPPVKEEEIEGDFLRTHIKNENCCGSDEFIKLYAYTLTDHPITVHLDMDVAILQPMDDIFDAMMFDKDSPEGKAARGRIEVEFPDDPLPDVIDAYFTRDYTSNKPWEINAGVQGGLLVARPNPEHLQRYIDFIREGNFNRGRGGNSGWGGKGYGGFQGAMAYQGAVAYFYDHILPTPTFVQLDTCRWNQVVADVIWRGPDGIEHKGECRRYPRDGNYAANTKCEDCRVTPIELVKTAHYTACKKPWECAVPHPRVPRDKSQVYRLSHLTNITTCMNLHKEWFKLRQDFEDSMVRFSAGETKISKRNGQYEKEFFLGYCNGSHRYIAMIPPPEDFDVDEMYGMSSSL